jgi:hypothetical protein
VRPIGVEAGAAKLELYVHPPMLKRTLRERFRCLRRLSCLRQPYRLSPTSFHESPSKWISLSAHTSVRYLFICQ